MNQGYILEYKPDLEIRSEPESGMSLEDTYSITDNFLANVEIDAKRSNTAIEFELHSPAKKIAFLSKTLEHAKKLKSSMEDSLSSTLYGDDYFTASDDEAKVILDNNFNDLEFGSVYLEIFAILKSLIEEMDSIMTLYIECIFGKDVDLDSVDSIEQVYLDKIQKFESEQNYEKVNYFNLYYDTQISYLIGEYASDVYKYIYGLSTIKEENKKNYVPDSNSKKIIKASFDKNNLLLNNDLYKASNVQDDIDTALNNIFLAKQDVNLYLDTFANIYKLDGASADFIQMKQETIDSLEQKLDNLVKTVMYSGIAKEDIIETLKKKSNYRSFFVA